MRFKRILYGVFGIVCFIGLWEVLRITTKDPAIISTAQICKSFLEIIKNTDFYANLFSTLKIVLFGILLAIAFGVGLGVLMDLFLPVRQTIMPVIEVLRNIPSITLFPILLVVYGVGDESRIFIIFWTASPAIILSTIYGLSTIEKSIIEAAYSCGANKFQTMSRIKLPLAIPEILNGIKIGVGSGFVAIVVAEMLGASKGLGFMVLWSTNAFKYSETYAYILIIGLVGALTNIAMNKIIKHYEEKLL